MRLVGFLILLLAVNFAFAEVEFNETKYDEGTFFAPMAIMHAFNTFYV